MPIARNFSISTVVVTIPRSVSGRYLRGDTRNVRLSQDGPPPLDRERAERQGRCPFGQTTKRRWKRLYQGSHGTGRCRPFRRRGTQAMRRQGWSYLMVASLLIWAGSGCCCVNSCYTGGNDFGGAGCNALCGGSCGGGGCGGGCGECGDCGGTAVGSYDLGACNVGCGPGWNAPQFFVDDCGNPCFGPVVGIVNALRNAYIGCGCGPMYVDEWVSDPPDCNDPCGSGCGGGCASCDGGGCSSCGGGGCASCGGGGCSSCGTTPLDQYYSQRKQRWGQHSVAHGARPAYTTSQANATGAPRGSLWGTQTRASGRSVAQQRQAPQTGAVRQASHAQQVRQPARPPQARPTGWGQPRASTQARPTNQVPSGRRATPPPPNWIRQVNWFN